MYLSLKHYFSITFLETNILCFLFSNNSSLICPHHSILLYSTIVFFFCLICSTFLFGIQPCGSIVKKWQYFYRNTLEPYHNSNFLLGWKKKMLWHFWCYIKVQLFGPLCPDFSRANAKEKSRPCATPRKQYRPNDPVIIV